MPWPPPPPRLRRPHGCLPRRTPATCSPTPVSPCKKSKAFQKREKGEIGSRRLKKYDADSAPALALKATMEKTKTRFANYGEAGLLCGADGLPHLIVDGNLEHLGEFAVPGLGFLYVAGWIGYAGRSYVMLNKEQSKKPTEGEINRRAHGARADDGGGRVAREDVLRAQERHPHRARVGDHRLAPLSATAF